MLIRMQLWKKLLKGSYTKEGLTLGMTETKILMIAGRKWIVNVDLEELPKEHKAVIISLTKDLPLPGEVVKHHKDDSPQFELPECTMGVIDIWSQRYSYDKDYSLTQIIIDGPTPQRLLRCTNQTRHIVGVPQEVIEGISRRASDPAPGEMGCVGPVGSIDYGAPRIIWHETGMVFAYEAAIPRDDGCPMDILFKTLEAPHLILTDTDQMADRIRQEERRKAEEEEQDEED